MMMLYNNILYPYCFTNTTQIFFFLLWRKMHSYTPQKIEKIGLKERAEIVVVRRFLT